MGTSFTSTPASEKSRAEWGRARFAPNPYFPCFGLSYFSCNMDMDFYAFFGAWRVWGFFLWLASQLSRDTIKLIRAKILPYISMVCTSTLFTATSQFSVDNIQKVKHCESLTSTAGFVHMGTRKPGISVNQGCPFDTMSLLQYLFALS